MSDSTAASIALSLGVSSLLTVICRRVRFPALLPLLLAGLAMGQSGLHVVDTTSLGVALKGVITVAIGLLIYEGALHLSRDELARAPRAVWGLITIGALITWVLGTLVAMYLLQLAWPVAVLLGATLIVTGPTVVQPILRVLHVPARLHAVLAAEAVLIDPIGVIATVSALEVLTLYFKAPVGTSFAGYGLWVFVRPILGGAGVGSVMGIIGFQMMRFYSGTGKIDPARLNLVALGVCMTCLGLGESITPEGGLAAVTVCGVIMARARVLGATELRSFKEMIATIIVGTLFVLLSSRFDLSRLHNFSAREFAFVPVMILGVRVVSVGIATIGSRLTVAERMFAATFAPRGIVALSVALIVSGELSSVVSNPEVAARAGGSERLLADAQRIEPLVFVTIIGSVLMATVFSPLLAWLLRLKAGSGKSVLVIGAHPLSIAFAQRLKDYNVVCRLIDSNQRRVDTAIAAEVDALCGDATDTRWLDDIGCAPDTGWVLAWTGNHDVDQLAARWAADRFGDKCVAFWSAKPARGQLIALDLGTLESIGNAVNQFVAARLGLSAAPIDDGQQQVIGYLVPNPKKRNSEFSFARPAKAEGALSLRLQPAATGAQVDSNILPNAENDAAAV